MTNSELNMETKSDTNDRIQLCSFWISSRLFGVNILDVKEIGSDIVMTPAYHAPPSVLGYMNIRGQIHLVIDVRRFFGFEENDAGANSRVVLFKPSVDEPFGILVDKMDDVVTVDASCLEERRNKKEPEDVYKETERRTASKDMTSGVCKIAKGLLVVLNARGILQSVEAGIETLKQ